MPPYESAACSICHHSGPHAAYEAEEMMYGLKDCFTYLECRGCGCIQLKNRPADYVRYYPSDYYSLQRERIKRDNWLKTASKRLNARDFFEGGNLIGRGLSWIDRRPDWFAKLKRCHIHLESSILDVGCGNGGDLLRMKRWGFHNLLGVDPYLEDDIKYENGVHILKKDMSSVEGQFDLITLNGSLEHMDDPHRVFGELRRLIRDRRFVVISIPLAGSFAWRKYKTNWVQLDPPRHLYIHSTRSIQLLAEAHGFDLAHVHYDSTEFQFWGSEQYLRNIPLKDPRSLSSSPSHPWLGDDQLKAFRKRAQELNDSCDGDQATFYLQGRSQPG